MRGLVQTRKLGGFVCASRNTPRQPPRSNVETRTAKLQPELKKNWREGLFIHHKPFIWGSRDIFANVAAGLHNSCFFHRIGLCSLLSHECKAILMLMFHKLQSRHIVALCSHSHHTNNSPSSPTTFPSLPIYPTSSSGFTSPIHLMRLTSHPSQLPPHSQSSYLKAPS